MSASEIIEEIQKLPMSERERVLEFLQNDQAQRQRSVQTVRYASDEAFEKSARTVLHDRADLLKRLAQ
jgi:hypothetical protein